MQLCPPERIKVKNEAGEEQTMFYISPLVYMAMNQLTPVLMQMRENPKDKGTWREGSVFATEWADKFEHYTNKSNWCVVGPENMRLPVSSGSVIMDMARRELLVILRVEQRTVREDFTNETFRSLKKWTLEDARGQQWILAQSLQVENGQITRVDPTINELKLEDSAQWTYMGQIEEFPKVEGLLFPHSARKFADGCGPDDPMFVLGLNMDACRPYRFSGRLDGSCFLYGRDMASRGSYTHFVWPLVAMPRGMDQSLATALVARDIALIEQHNLSMHRALPTGGIRWQKVYAHLGNFVSDRMGSDNPLGRLHAGAFTKNEWKGFAGRNQGFTIGERDDEKSQHPFHGSTRLFRGVCA